LTLALALQVWSSPFLSRLLYAWLPLCLPGVQLACFPRTISLLLPVFSEISIW